MQISEIIEKLRKHEDELISSRTSIFLIANGLLAAAIGVSSLNQTAKLPLAGLGTVLSIFWLLIGIRQRALMDWYYERITNGIDCQSCDISKIHKELSNFKKTSRSYLYTGQKIHLRAITIISIWMPVCFLIFWGFMIFILMQ